MATVRLAQRAGLLSILVVLVVACGPGARGESARPAPAGGAPAAAAPAPAGAAPDVFAAAKALPLDELYGKAQAEGGTLSFYSTMATVNADRILPAFEQRFPGVKVEFVNGTADKLVARAVSEARGGKVLGDVFNASVEYVQQLNQQRLLLQDIPTEALAIPEDQRGPYWFASDLQFIVPSWNTNLVKPDEAPRQFEDFTDPKWKNRLIAEPRDVELLMALSRKYGSEEQAVGVLRAIAANNVEFHKGHSELAELVVAGQAAACITCYAHHYPARMKKGAPVDFMRTEGIGQVVGMAAFQGAPHPYTAMLWLRWTASEEGQQAFSEGGRTPARPDVPAQDDTRPARIYALGPDDMAASSQYDKTWKEIFQLR
ncbi:MAG TPA: extracellular solute-binding protein [Chloroflexota bacterium]|nr:extracellular solute-binding protein [Chloroflexota bacterium]